MREQQLTDWQKQYIKTHVHRNQPFDAYKFFQDYINFILDPDDSIDVDWDDVDLTEQPNIVSFLNSVGIKIPSQQVTVRLSELLDGYNPYRYGSSDLVLGETILRLLGDCYDCFDDNSVCWDYAKTMVPKQLPQKWTQQMQQHVLDKLGLTWEQFYEIVVEESDSQDYEEIIDNIDVDGLQREITCAYSEAEATDSQDNYIEDLKSEIQDSLKSCGVSMQDFELEDEDATLTLSIDDFEKFNSALLDSDLFDYADSFDQQHVIKYVFQDNFRLYEPRNSWWDVTDDTFMEYLTDRLINAI